MDVVLLASLQCQFVGIIKSTILDIVATEIETLGEVATGSEVEQACARAVRVGPCTQLLAEHDEITLRNTVVGSLSEVVGQQVGRYVRRVDDHLAHVDSEDGVAEDGIIEAQLRINLRHADGIFAINQVASACTSEGDIIAESFSRHHSKLLIVEFGIKSSAVNQLVELQFELADAVGQVERAILRISLHHHRSEVSIGIAFVVLNLAIVVCNTREVIDITTRT